MPFQLPREPERMSTEPLFSMAQSDATASDGLGEVATTSKKGADSSRIDSSGVDSFRVAERGQAVFAAILFFILSVAGVYVSYSAVEDFAAARASGKWAQAEGVVLSPDSGPGDLRYAYIVDGKRHESQRLSYLTRGLIGSPPRTDPGARVKVYVSPTDPAEAVLVPGGSGRRFAVWFAFGGLIVFIGFAGLIRAMMAIDFPEFRRHGPRETGEGDPYSGAFSADPDIKNRDFSEPGYAPAE